MDSCPACNAAIKSGLLSSNALLATSSIDVINWATNKKETAYCQKCGTPILNNAVDKLKNRIQALKEELYQNIRNIPILTINNPLGWDYIAFGIVTSQSVTGTGVLSELTQSFDDFFGSSSKTLNSKLKDGEEICFTQLRKQAIDLGANAIIGTDVDYAELGSGRGMIMVCSAGTAVYLNNTEVLGNEISSIIEQIPELNDSLNEMTEMLENYTSNLP